MIFQFFGRIGEKKFMQFNRLLKENKKR